jgi:hypothetical protein
MNLTDKEKKLFSIFLDEFHDQLGGSICNDLSKEMRDLLTKEEWIAMDKEFHTMNGDPENHDPNHNSMMDFMVLYYLRKKLGV